MIFDVIIGNAQFIDAICCVSYESTCMEFACYFSVALDDNAPQPKTN